MIGLPIYDYKYINNFTKFNGLCINIHSSHILENIPIDEVSWSNLSENSNYVAIELLHLFTFQTPIFTALKKIKKCKINFDGLTFSSSLWLAKK